MLYFLLFISVFTETLKNICNNFFGKNILKSTADSLLFNIVGGVGATIFFLFTTSNFSISGFSLILAIIFALITAAANYFSLMAVATGPMSASTLFVYMGMIIPIIFGVTYYKQPVSVCQAVGCILMIVSLFLCIKIKKSSKTSLKWFLFAFSSFIAWGLVGICQQIHQKSPYAHELDSFLLWTFIFLTLFFILIYTGVRRKTQKSDCGYTLTNKITLFVISSGIIIGVVNKINLYLAGQLPGILFFPVVNGGVLLLSELAAITLFKEKATPRQLIGIVIGIISVCLLGI